MIEAGLLKEKIWIEETPVEASDMGGNERYVNHTSFQSTCPSMSDSENMSKPILEKCFSLLLEYLPDSHETFIGLANDVEVIAELAKNVSFPFFWFTSHVSSRCKNARAVVERMTRVRSQMLLSNSS
jgi:hypothetical protein